MKARIALPIETRSNQEGCSLNCPYLRILGGRPFDYECSLFGVVDRPPGWRCPRRHRNCVSSQIPIPEEQRLAKARIPVSNAPTTWDRLNGHDKL